MDTANSEPAGQGWIWTVYPRRSADPMVSVGHSGTEETARKRVEDELGTVGNSAFGVIIGPGGRHYSCRRGRQGGAFRWKPLFGS